MTKIKCHKASLWRGPGNVCPQPDNATVEITWRWADEKVTPPTYKHTYCESCAEYIRAAPKDDICKIEVLGERPIDDAFHSQKAKEAGMLL